MQDGSGERERLDQRALGGVGLDQRGGFLRRGAATNEGEADDLDQLADMEVTGRQALAKGADAGAGLAFKLDNEVRREGEG